MSKLRKLLLAVILLGVLAVIILTWGSIGSSILTLALLLALGYLLLRRVWIDRNDEDYWLED